MAKGDIAAGLALLLGASVTLAQPACTGNDCSTLERVVRESVYRAATEYKPALSQGRPGLSLQGGALAYRQACPRTVEVTTSAFTLALADLGFLIGWYPPHPSGFCWSGDLSQCYPRSRRGEPALAPDQLAFVYGAWDAVQNTVISHMRRGSSSGVSTFTADSLEATLWSNLQLMVEGPLHLGYAHTELPARR